MSPKIKHLTKKICLLTLPNAYLTQIDLLLMGQYLYSVEKANKHVWLILLKHEQNCGLTWLISGRIQKTSRYVLSKQEGTEKSKKPSHATVPLMNQK